MAFYDLETHPSMYANPINSSNRSNSPSVEKPQRSPTARQTIDDLKLFGKPSISYIKPRRHSQRKNLKLTKNLDIVKPFFSPEKTKASIYSRISGLNGILSTSPTLSKKSPEYRLGTSNAFLMSEMSVTPNKSVLATHHDLEKGRPRTSYYSSFEDKQLHNKSSGYNNLFNNSLGQFPLNHVISGSPNKSQIHNSPPKEFVNIHVQKLHEKPRPKVKGRFFFPSPSARLSTK